MLDQIESATTVLSNITSSPTADNGQHSSTEKFSDYLQRDLLSLNYSIQNADTELRNYALGKTDNIHHLMLTLEKSMTQFEYFMQVRNKLIEGYKEILRMQI